MKLKFVLIPLVVLGLVVVSYADCSKDEIMKLIDKGYTKSEIKGICGKSEPEKKKSKWISPTQKDCKANGGKMTGYICYANWSDAKDICRASGGRLATIDELKKVVTDCGGTIDDNNNKADAIYQDCCKEKGFNDYHYYWSSTTGVSNTNGAWGVGFYYGGTGINDKSGNGYVRCVRSGQ